MHWKAKLLTQFILGHIPKGDVLNYRIQVARGHYERDTLRKRIVDRLPVYRKLLKFASLKGATIVEVGTGWELLDPLLMYAFGSECVYTFDQIRHLRFRAPHIITGEMQGLAGVLEAEGADPDRIGRMAEADTLDQLLSLANIRYIAPGDACNTGLADSSVDLFFSIAVLEHVPPTVLAGLADESRRVLKPTGLSFHIVDPGDHYREHGVSQINFLQYSDRFWNFWVQNRLSYHNRLRAAEFIDAFTQHGFEIKSIESRTEPGDVAALKSGFPVDSRFSRFTPEELAVHHLEIVAAPVIAKAPGQN